MRESKFQAQIIKWLKDEGCYVIKNSAIAGVPVGCPDIVFFKGKFYGFLEVKPSAKAPFQPLQEITLERLGKEGWAKVVYPENWHAIRLELRDLL